MVKIKVIEKSEIIIVMQVNIEGQHKVFANSKFNVPNEISVVFDNGSNYDYHFVMRELANKCEGQFECLGESKEEYKTFSVPIKKKITKIDKYGSKSFVNTSCKIRFIDSMGIERLPQV